MSDLFWIDLNEWHQRATELGPYLGTLEPAGTGTRCHTCGRPVAEKKVWAYHQPSGTGWERPALVCGGCHMEIKALDRPTAGRPNGVRTRLPRRAGG